MSQFQLLDSVFCNNTFIRNVWNSKMSQFGKKGGGAAFFKNVWNSKMSQRSEGGEGSTPIGILSQIFSIFYFDGFPYPNIFLNSILKEGNLKKKICHYPTSIPSRPQLDVKLNKKPFTPTNQTWSDRNFPIGSGSLFIRV